jgi:hypothetical protein
MKIGDVKTRNKVLLVGDSGTGKTHISLMVSFLFSKNGKKVVYIDPEDGAGREIKELYNSGKIGNEELESIEKIDAVNWEEFKDAIVKADGDLIVVDCMSEAMKQFENYLKQKFIGQGYYVVKDKEIKIKDESTFTVPWELVSRVYDKLLEVMYYLLRDKRDSHFIVTLHPIGGTTARDELQNSIMAKTDTVIELDSVVNEGRRSFIGVVRKNRGGVSAVRLKEPDKAVLKMFEKVL